MPEIRWIGKKEILGAVQGGGGAVFAGCVRAFGGGRQGGEFGI